MVLRDLILGGGASCQPTDGASSASNPLGGLADSLLGSASKSQDIVREFSGLTVPGRQSSLQLAGPSGPLISLPGSEFAQQEAPPSNIQVDFLRQFSNSEHGGFDDAWEEANAAQMRSLSGNFELDRLREFEAIYNDDTGPPVHPQTALSGVLHTFLESRRAEAAFPTFRMPKLGLSESDKRRIRDRSSIMGRHFFADKGDEFATAQVSALLHSLDIEDGPRRAEPPGFEEYWKEAQGAWPGNRQENNGSGAGPSNFNPLSQGQTWADEFQLPESDSWAAEYEQSRGQMVRGVHLTQSDSDNQSILNQTSSLVRTLSENQDPKFKNSKFLQFVSKMSRGELIFDNSTDSVDGGVDDGGWANEFQEHISASGDSAWAGEHAHRGDNWVDDFVQNRQGRGLQIENSDNDQTLRSWGDEFGRSWGDEYGDQVAEGSLGHDAASSWLDTYDKFVEEQLKLNNNQGGASRFVYGFADQNPYVGHPNPLREGQELFRRGLLSEAVLALEAEVLRNPDNSEAWRLLGITHAENDDDRQAIASMVQAKNADSTNLEVLLALGVSHTNELEQAEALQYLRGWLENNPKYSQLVQPDAAQHLSHSQVVELFNRAASLSPEDGDVHTVLGVLYNLSREYEKAIHAFQTALKLKPRDYSLWNKLGATQANSARSADAIFAYQQALELKPNYVRAWANMGIGFANQGQYEDSIQYYVRALSMNPKADNAWQYLRMSVSCASRPDLLDACDKKQIEVLQKHYGL